MLCCCLSDLQDDENGGIADRPGDMADVFHTFFGVAGKNAVDGSLMIRFITTGLRGTT